MARVLTQNFALSYVIETALGVAGTTGIRRLQPNGISKWGAEVKQVYRNPISKNRLQLEGVTVDLDSAVEFTSDLTMDHAVDFLEGFMFAKFTGPGLTAGTPFLPTAVTSTGYTVDSGGDLVAGTLIYAKGFATSGNNGLKVVGSSSTTTEIKTSGLTAETGTAARNATVTICGWQAASDDFSIDSSYNLNSAATVFSTSPFDALVVGEEVYIGDDNAAGTHFATCPSSFARVVAKTNAKITLDNWTSTPAADAGTGKTVRIFFGRFVTNKDVDDSNYLERSFTFEGLFENLGNPSGNEYQYPKGNYCNEATFHLPLGDKATVTWNFMGTDTPIPTSSRKTGFSSAVSPIMNSVYNTVDDVAWLRLAETDGTSRAQYFKSLDVKFMNHISAEKTIGTLGATFMNVGKFGLEVDGEILFTDSAVLSAIRNARTLQLNFCLKDTNDGAMFFNIPSMKITGGNLQLPENESVRVKWKGTAFQDSLLGTAIGITLFPYLPI